MQSEWLLLDDVAREMRVPLGTVRHWIKTRRLASSRPGRRRLVLREDLDALIASCRTPALDVGARGLTIRGGNPGRLAPTADPNVEGDEAAACATASVGGADRPGVVGGEARSAEGAQPTCPCHANGGARARSGETPR